MQRVEEKREMDAVNTNSPHVKLDVEDRDKIYLEREEFSESGCKVDIK